MRKAKEFRVLELSHKMDWGIPSPAFSLGPPTTSSCMLCTVMEWEWPLKQLSQPFHKQQLVFLQVMHNRTQEKCSNYHRRSCYKKCGGRKIHGMAM